MFVVRVKVYLKIVQVSIWLTYIFVMSTCEAYRGYGIESNEHYAVAKLQHILKIVIIRPQITCSYKQVFGILCLTFLVNKCKFS
jgi:hypothetical protein